MTKINSIRFVLLISLILGSASCDNSRVKGTITFEGTKINKLTSVQPKFWFRNEDKNTIMNPNIKYKKGELAIYDIPPGNYGMSVDIDANLENPSMYPGDYRSWTQFSVTEGNKTYLDIELNKIIHLLLPQDNSVVMQHWDSECENKASFPALLKFSWESMGNDVYYDYSIQKMSCKPYKTIDSVIGATSKDTTVSMTLPESAPNEFYQFNLAARKNGKIIGTLMTHGGIGYGWDYRFRVK
jgi:hypothetical protein